MFEVNVDTVCFIINKCREFQAKDSVEIDAGPDGMGDDWASRMLSSYEDEVTVQEVRGAFESLEPAQQAEVVALMWVGRGDFDASEWVEARSEAKSAWTPPPRTADYVMSTPLAADYLEDGIGAFGFDCED
ncbi:DUF3775 domain-containing protein [Halorhodospira halochloris]|uniref:DUF3775 domain-containing protein n=1 Tax=Halorhodospira halochloris TaxID=1052 RepID=UPI001EE841C3|nr:DUF3775 domain-containing protein [Halorhodospira halochloris]MCG5548878.1 DUF3775 domain-containing protein [Halorhodospira halochloris]